MVPQPVFRGEAPTRLLADRMLRSGTALARIDGRAAPRKGPHQLPGGVTGRAVWVSFSRAVSRTSPWQGVSGKQLTYPLCE
jgi:hypothetical protein